MDPVPGREGELGALAIILVSVCAYLLLELEWRQLLTRPGVVKIGTKVVFAFLYMYVGTMYMYDVTWSHPICCSCLDRGVWCQSILCNP